MPNSRPAKRQRIYRACDQCRSRKTKCDGEQPVCSICLTANRACTYQNGGGRRGLPSGYVRSLEVVLGLVFQHVPNSEAAIHGVLRDSQADGNFLASDLANHSRSIWQKSRLSRDVSQLLSPGFEGSVLGFEGPVLDDSEEEWTETGDQEGSINGSTNMPSSGHGHLDSPPLPELPIKLHTTFANRSIPDNTPDLLDFYFKYTHCWLPILERRDLLRAMHMNPDQSSPETTAGRTLLWSVILYTSAARGSQCPGLPTPLELQLSLCEQSQSFPHCSPLGHIQAILILILLQILMRNFNEAWVLVGQASRKVVLLPVSARTSRFKHTFNGCVLLDNILSTILGKTPCLSQAEQFQHGPVQEGDSDEWEVWSAPRASCGERPTRIAPLRSLSVFNLVLSLMQPLSQIQYQCGNLIPIEDSLEKLRQQQGSILQQHPYDRNANSNPPLIILHLTSLLTTLSLVRKSEQVSPTISDLCTRAIHRSLDIMDHYLEITGSFGLSPLVYCFAVQCQRCLDTIISTVSLTVKDAISKRLQIYMRRIDQFSEFASRSQFIQPSVPHQPGDPMESIEASIPATQEAIGAQSIRPAELHRQEGQQDMTLPDLPSTGDSTFQSLHDSTETEGYDTLFEELAISYPSSMYVSHDSLPYVNTDLAQARARFCV